MSEKDCKDDIPDSGDSRNWPMANDYIENPAGQY